MSDEVPTQLAAYGITAAHVIEAHEYEDSMFIAHQGDDGRTWGLVIEFDEQGVRETANYLRSQGVEVKRERG